jgi:hypothetical protein
MSDAGARYLADADELRIHRARGTRVGEFAQKDGGVEGNNETVQARVAA